MLTFIGSPRPYRRVIAVAAAGAGIAAALVGTGVADAAGGKPTPAATTQNLGAYTRVVGPAITLPPGGFMGASVSCPAGEAVLGGGESNTAPGTLVLTDSFPFTTANWQVYVKSNAASNELFFAYALCAV